MVLVDTSVWIEVFRKPSRFRLESAVETDEIVTCLPVVQEVLQGFRNERARAMLSFPVVEPPLRTAQSSRLSSTRRFVARPLSVASSAIGFDSPYPFVVIREASIPLEAR